MSEPKIYTIRGEKLLLFENKLWRPCEEHGPEKSEKAIPEKKELISQEEFNKIIKAVQAGVTVKKLAESYGVTAESIYKRLRKNGIKMRDSRKIPLFRYKCSCCDHVFESAMPFDKVNECPSCRVYGQTFEQIQ